MNILVTGADGQLGRELNKAFAGQYNNKDSRDEYFFCNKNQLDITRKDLVSNFISQNKIDIVINAGAFTRVDDAESDSDLAMDINYLGVQNIVSALEDRNGLIIQISTDYVFSGENTVPYPEDAAKKPLSVYGKSKLMGEECIQNSSINYLIIRTSWLYSAFGKNFFTTIYNKIINNNHLKVVNDQFGAPTYAKDLAIFIKYLLKNIEFGIHEVIHFSNTGETTWYDFSVEIGKLSNKEFSIQPISSQLLNLPAPRPKYAVLSLDKCIKLTQFKIDSWEAACKRCYQDMFTERDLNK